MSLHTKISATDTKGPPRPPPSTRTVPRMPKRLIVLSRRVPTAPEGDADPVSEAEEEEEEKEVLPPPPALKRKRSHSSINSSSDGASISLCKLNDLSGRRSVHSPGGSVSTTPCLETPPEEKGRIIFIPVNRQKRSFGL